MELSEASMTEDCLQEIFAWLDPLSLTLLSFCDRSLEVRLRTKRLKKSQICDFFSRTD